MNGRSVGRHDWQAPALACLVLICFANPGRCDDTPLSLADLPAYQSALASSPDQPAISVSFRDLWDRSADHQGKRVRVQGQVERVFHQPAIGKLPALAEAWIVTSTKDPICLVFPDGPLEPGSIVAFEGDYLKRLRYGGADTERLAPLVVGPRAPLVLTTAQDAKAPASGSVAGLDLMFGLIVAMIVVLGFVRVLVRRPRRALRLDSDPDPVFDDGSPL